MKPNEVKLQIEQKRQRNVINAVEHIYKQMISTESLCINFYSMHLRNKSPIVILECIVDDVIKKLEKDGWCVDRQDIYDDETWVYKYNVEEKLNETD